MELQGAELAFDDQKPGPHIGAFQHNVRQRLNIQAGRDLDDLRGHAQAGQGAAHPGGDIGQRLRLKLVDEDGGPEVGHFPAP